MYAFEKRWVTALLEAWAPPGDGRFAPTGEVAYAPTFARMRANATALAGFGMRLALWIFAFAPIWRKGRLCLVTGLSLNDRTALFHDLMNSRVFFLREMSVLFKLVASLAMFTDPNFRARSGYDPPGWLEEQKAQAKNRLVEPQNLLARDAAKGPKPVRGTV